MGLDYVDIFYSHRYDPETPLEETMGALATAVQQGKALYVGISNYEPEEAVKAIEILDDLGVPCLIHQMKYSMLHRDPENRLHDLLKEKGVGSIAFSPLAQGLLTDRYLNGIPEDSRIAKNVGFLTTDHLNEELIAKLNSLNDLASERDQSLAQMAMAWVIRDSVTSVLIGASRKSQLLNNLGTLDNLSFSNEELNQIEEVLRG
jgi:L-glyceraldehyde 3-phosphate reductase